MEQTSGSGGGLTLIDQGPLHTNATVGAGTPSIVPNVLNGKPILRLNGINDYMVFAGSNVLMPINGNSTVVIVAKGVVLSGAAFGTMLALMTGSGGYEGFLTTGASSGYAPFFMGGGNGTVSPPSYVGVSPFNYSSQFFSLCVGFQGAGDFGSVGAFSVTKNNVLQSVIASGPSSTNGGSNQIGQWPNAAGGLNFPGDIAEIIVFARLPDAQFRSNLQGYLVTKYGSQLGLV